MIVTERSTPAYALREAGGKGYGLFLLSRAGYRVPSWVVLGVRYFAAFCAEAGLDARIAQAIAKGVAENDLARAAETVRGLVLQAPLPLDVDAAIRSAWKAVSVGGAVAVRSSAAGEDAPKHSFAGQLSTFLYLRTEDEVRAAVKECWASAYSERSLSYRVQRGLRLERVAVAVVVQRMVDADVSGVAFSCDPVDGSPDVVTINAVYGIGEGLVSGQLEADTFIVDKTSKRELRRTLATKNARLVQRAGQPGLAEEPTGASERSAPCLTAAVVIELADLAIQLEHFYRGAQDIEWASAGGDLYVLQARPVTTGVRATEGKLHIWDNSNIVESYGGLTLPLTFSFAHRVYGHVYVQLCELLSVRRREIDDMRPFLENMVGLVHGRVYYNLLNWYKLTATLLPGFGFNREFMETMMGTGQSLADEIADRIRSAPSENRLPSRIRRLWSGAKFFYFHLTAQSLTDDFLTYFRSVYDEYRKKDYDRMLPNEIHEDYLALERRLLREWKAPIVNDFLCMIHFGLLKKLTSKWLAHAGGESLQNDLMCGEGNMESAEPTKELVRTAILVQADAGLRALLEETPAADCAEALAQSPFGEFKTRVDRYIELYGHRCMSEMKLEQKDLNQDPTFLFACIKNYLRTGPIDIEAHERREQATRAAAEQKVKTELRGLRRVVYAWSLRHARRAVRNRENMRFCRTRIYGVVRGMFFAMGKDFTRQGLIDTPEDVFHLTLQEVFGSLDGLLSCENLRALVDVRKKEYERYEGMETPSRFMTRGAVYWASPSTPAPAEAATPADLPANCLKGTGCSAGRVEGVVKVVLSPTDDLALDGEILVTMRTDPGWIPLYPSISGLLVERGGLLSHSAIVAREMGIPTVVGIAGLTKRIRSGARVRIDGRSGLVELLSAE